MRLLPPPDESQPRGGTVGTGSQRIAAQIRAAERTDSDAVALTERRRACRAARDLVSDDPLAGRRLAPVLVDVLEEELRREDDAAVAELFFTGISGDVQRTAAEALADAAGPALVRGYERSPVTLSSLVTTLASALTLSDDHETAKQCLVALSRVTRVRPDVVNSFVPVADVTKAVGSLVGQLDQALAARDAALVLFVLATRSPETVWQAGPVSEWTETLSQSSDDATARFARAVGATDPDIEEGVLSTPPVAELRECVRSCDRQRRRVAARQLGVLCSLLPDDRTPLPPALGRRVRDSADRGNWRTTVAAGEASADVHGGDDAFGAHQRRRVQEMTGERRRTEAAVLGELAVACPDRFEAVPDPLVAAVTNQPAPSAQSLAAVGEWVAVCGTETDPSRTLCRRVRDEGGTARTSAAVALGEWAAHTPPRFASAPGPLVAAAAEQSGEAREAAAFALGVAVTAAEADDFDCRRLVRSSTGAFRERAAWAVGELAVAESDQFGADVPAYVDLPSDADPGIRRGALTALGIAVAATDDGPPVSVLRKWVQSAPAGERRDRLRHLGAWVAAVPASVPGDPTALVDRVRGTDGPERDRAAETLGEAVVSGDVGSGALGELLSRIPVVDGVWQCSMDALERAAEAVDGVDGDRWVLDHPRYTGQDVGWVARVAGEVAAATGEAPTDGLAPLYREVRQSDGWHRVGAARALGVALAVASADVAYHTGALVDRLRSDCRDRETWATLLGETVAASPELVADPPAPLVERVRASSGLDRQLMARALGEVVAATPKGTQPPMEVLAESVSEATAESRPHLARSFGVALAVCPSWADGAPDPLVAATSETSGRDRRAVARALGETMARGSVTAALATVSPGLGDTSVFERDWRSRATAALARIDAVEPGDLLAALDFEHGEGEAPVDGLLGFRDPMRTELLQALATAASAHDHAPPGLREALVTAMATDDSLGTETRLAVVDVLSVLRPTGQPIRGPTQSSL